MSLRGSLKTMPVADLFEWLERRQPAGELTLDRANQTRRFQLAAGAVTGASSTDPAEYLGQILLNTGVITEAQLADAYAAQASDGILVGRILVVNGVVGEVALREAIELKIRESLFDALSWTDGNFSFDPVGDTPRPLEVEVALPLAPMVAQGAERAAQWRVLRAEIPDDGCRFFLPDKTWLDRAKRGSPSALILAEVQRGLSVREISLALHSMPFPIYQRLFELMARGILKIDRRATARREKDATIPPEQLIEAARGRAKGGDRPGALEMAKRALADAPANEAIKKAYQEIERGLFAELSRTLLARFRVPKLLKPRDELAATPLSAEERYLVDRIDGHWDLLSLMRVSPLREVDALITFSKLADKGLISLE
jgi:hypothetical protein